MGEESGNLDGTQEIEDSVCQGWSLSVFLHQDRYPVDLKDRVFVHHI